MEKSSRPKYWSELNSDEKIERMRDEVKMLKSQSQNFVNKMNRLENHEHSPSGKILTPYNQNSGLGIAMSSGGIISNPNEVYF